MKTGSINNRINIKNNMIKIMMIGVILLSLINTGNIIFSKADEDNTRYSSIKRDTHISLDSSGNLNITRSDKKKNPMGKDSWSIFIYMTGSDLESNYQSATKDIQEMLAAKCDNPNVNLIIQTGGCGKWHTEGIDVSNLGRYRIIGDKLEKIDTVDLASMGKASTLYNYLEWGVTNYPAEHMAVIFWDHGSGISKGLCNDMLYNDDSLSLGEVEYTFAKLNDTVMTDQFELIGFDTCLSGSLEYANALAVYSKYMVASADVEPNDGWYYTDFIKNINENIDVTGKEVGKTIVDSYVDYHTKNNNGEFVTMATYDLSQVDKVCYEINSFAKYLNDTLKTEDVAKVLDIIGSPKVYTYGNMDLGSLVKSLNSSNTYDASSIENALNKLIIYNRIGSGYEKNGCNGITIFSPLSLMSMSDFNICRNALVSPYWLNILEAITAYSMQREAKVYGANISYTINEWENSDMYYEDTFDYVQYENPLYSDSETYKLLKTNSKYNFASKWNSLFKAYKDAINTSPSSYGGFGMDMRCTPISKKISDTTNVKDVYSSVYKEEEDRIVCLGEQANIKFNKDTGDMSSDVLDQWFALLDGQLLTTYVIDNTDTYTIYGFPVVINDVESMIKIKETKTNTEKKEYTVLGVWDGTLKSNYVPRGYIPLEIGTVITPIYDVYNKNTNEYETEYGEEYVVGSEFDFVYVKLENEGYSFGVIMDMMFGKSIMAGVIR